VAPGGRAGSADLIARVNRDVERSLLRARNGVRYVRGTHRPQLGTTPKDVVWRRGRAQLWRYRGGEVRYGPPVVIVHSLVSRSYILDLRPGHSTVEFLVGAGLDVFMLDWGVPDERDADNTLETYVDGYLPRALAAVEHETGCHEVTLAGYCLGGLMAMLYAAGHPGAVRNLVLMATPIDFGAMGAMVAALREGRLNAEDLLDETGNVPADALYSGFYMLAPTTEIAQKATLLEHLWNDEFVEAYQAMAQWTRDHVPFPGAAFRQVVEQLVRENVLTTGAIRLGERVVRLGDARGEVLVAMAERDGVVPAGATEPALRLVGDPRRRHALRLPGGHVTFGAGNAARKHTMPRLTEWITAHSDERPDPKEAAWRSAASTLPTGPRSNGSWTRSPLRIERS
jgi:polyhydroxyalkanoate synthase subunit PhaC